MEFPSSLRYIGGRAFYNQRLLEAAYLPEDFVGVSDFGFYCCGALREVYLPDKMEYIGKYAFSNCIIERLKLPENLDRAETGAFSANTKLKEIVIPAGVKHIKENCFSGCDALTSVSSSASTDIAEDAFKNCINLITDSYYPTAASADFAGGDGSSENPYLIADENQLKNIEKDLGASYRLINDIELSDEYNYVISDGRLTENGNLTPVFHGTLDGGGHTVSRLNIDVKGMRAGLFGCIRNAHIKDLNVLVRSGGSIKLLFGSGTAYLGGICGYNQGGTIENCKAAAVLSVLSDTAAPTDKYRVAGVYAGGIAGMNNGEIKNCAGVVSISCNERVLTRDAGGVCGFNSGSIESCTSRVNRQTEALYNCVDNNGGIVSENGGSISNCYADGDMGIIVSSYYGPFGFSGARGTSCQPSMAGTAVKNSGTVSGCTFNGSIYADFTEGFYKSRSAYVTR